jgi:hypothetical protein
MVNICYIIGMKFNVCSIKKLAFCGFLVFAAFFSSCAARISGQFDQKGAGSFTVSASLQPRISALIRSFQALAGAQPGAMIIDGEGISESLAGAPGLASVSFRNAAPAAIEGPVKISRIDDFLAIGGAGGFVRFEQTAGKPGGTCIIYLDRGMGPGMLSMLSPEIAAYLEALMAPLATGEAIGKDEYLDLVGSVYGKGIADEIAESVISASIDFPGKVQSVKGGTFFGSRAEFKIPLVELLVMEMPLSYSASWN